VSAPDLTMARSTMRRRMTDRVRVDRDVEGTGDDITDPETGNVTVPLSDSSRVYEGPAMVTERAMIGQVVVQGSVDETRQRYQVSIPFESPPILIGDLVTVLAAADPHLVAKPLRVTQVAYGTHVARRRLTCELSTPALRT